MAQKSTGPRTCANRYFACYFEIFFSVADKFFDSDVQKIGGANDLVQVLHILGTQDL